MGLFDRIFRRQEKRPVVQFINEQTGAFTSTCGDAYSNDIYRGAVDARSKFFSSAISLALAFDK